MGNACARCCPCCWCCHDSTEITKTTERDRLLGGSTTDVMQLQRQLAQAEAAATLAREQLALAERQHAAEVSRLTGAKGGKPDLALHTEISQMHAALSMLTAQTTQYFQANTTVTAAGDNSELKHQVQQQHTAIVALEAAVRQLRKELLEKEEKRLREDRQQREQLQQQQRESSAAARPAVSQVKTQTEASVDSRAEAEQLRSQLAALASQREVELETKELLQEDVERLQAEVDRLQAELDGLKPPPSPAVSDTPSESLPSSATESRRPSSARGPQFKPRADDNVHRRVSEILSELQMDEGLLEFRGQGKYRLKGSDKTLNISIRSVRCLGRMVVERDGMRKKSK